MRTFQRALLALSLALLCGSVGWTQSNETFSAGAGGAYDASVCNDPKIAVNAAAQKATPYHDATPTGQPDPLLAALSYLGQKDGLPYLNRASVCLHAPGVVFMVPNNLVGQVTTLVGQIEASEPGGANNNGSGGTPSSGQPGGTNGTNKNDQPIAGGTNGGNGTPGSGNNNGGPANNRGGPTNSRGGPPSYTDTPQIPGPAGGIGYKPGPNPCVTPGPTGYNYCDNGPGAYLPPGCHCDGPPPSPDATGGKTIKRKLGPSQPAPIQSTPAPPNLLVMQKAMNDCLSSKVPYWVATNIQSQYMQAARSSASPSVRSTPPEALPYQTQVFIVETAMALQAQAFHDRKYGQGKYDPTDARDTINPAYAPSYLAGWFDRCLATSGLQPKKDDRTAYAKFLGAGVKDNRILAFGSGYVYGDVLAPVTMLTPYVPAAP